MQAFSNWARHIHKHIVKSSLLVLKETRMIADHLGSLRPTYWFKILLVILISVKPALDEKDTGADIQDAVSLRDDNRVTERSEGNL